MSRSFFHKLHYMAYAIIKTGGKQYKVSEGDILNVERLAVEPGTVATFDEVLLLASGDSIQQGTPSLTGATVTAKVLDQHKAKKVIAYKFRRRKGYHRTVGHRRQLTKVRIEKITA